MTEGLENVLGALTCVILGVMIIVTFFIAAYWDAKDKKQIAQQESKFLSKLNEKEKALILDYKQCKKIQRKKKGKEKQCKTE